MSHSEYENFFPKPSNVTAFYGKRKIIFCDEINEETCFTFVNFVEKFLEHDDKIGIKDPITIEINSGGGLVYYGLTIVSTIERLKSLGYKVITKNIGICASMAFVVSVCGTERRAYDNSVYMYHDVSSVAYGSLQTLKEEVEDLQRLKNKVDNVVKKYTKLTDDDIKDICIRKMDKYFYSDEALEKGICDCVE